VAPARTGFGSKLIERGLSGYLGGSVTIDYAPEGLVCRALVNVGPSAG
jgi:two-component sensor histidine kinase